MVFDRESQFFLQGIDVNVKDIDIVIFFKDYEKVKKLFSDFDIKEEKKLLNGDGVETRYIINNVEVQFCFEYDSGFYIKKLGNKFDRDNLVHLVLNSLEISCFNLRDELAGYEYLGRKEKAQIISNFLQNANTRQYT